MEEVRIQKRGGDPIPKKSQYPKTPSSEEKLAEAKRLCHIHCAQSCVDQKRRGLHLKLLKTRPHWSVLRRKEQERIIDRGETEPFDIAIPLPAKDRRDPEGTSWGADLFWERFRCAGCGRCCYTPGAGLYLDEEEMDRICQHLGWSRKRLLGLCRYERTARVWALKQPCPFYDPEGGCTIYPVRPLTCTRYPLHPALKEMPYHLAVDAFCPAAREFVKETLGWWIVCERNWARILRITEEEDKRDMVRR